jgi:hypothetical protein
VGTPGRRIVADEIRYGALAALGPFIAGALAGFVLLFADFPFEKLLGGDAWSNAGREFLRRPETLVWLTLLCAQAGIWVVGGLASRRVLAALAAGRSRPVALAGFAMLLLLIGAVIVVPASATPVATPLPLHRPKIIAFILLGFAAAAPWILAIWRIGRIARAPTADELAEAVGPPGGHPFDGYLRLRELLGNAVVVLGIIVAGITLTTGALRQVVLKEGGDFPPSSVLVYGGFFSLLLVLIYVPVQLRIIELGRYLRDAAAPLSPGAPVDDHAFERRAKAETLLQLTAGPVASAQAGLAILAPFVTALVGALASSD